MLIGFWLFVTSLFIIRSFLAGNLSNPLSFANFLYEFICLSPWIFAVIFLGILNEKLSTHGGFKLLMFHVFLALTVFIIHSTIQTYTNSIYEASASFSYEYIKADFIYFFDVRTLLYIGILIGFKYDEFYNKKAELLLHKEKLKTELEKTKLSSIAHDVQPEFLIKNIDGLSSLIYQDPKRAKDLLVSLSDLIRLLIRNSKEFTISLANDIQIYKYYVNFLSFKIKRDVKLSYETTSISTDKNIPKTFFIIPLIDSFIDKCTFEYLGRFNELHYSISKSKKKLFLKIIFTNVKIVNYDVFHNKIQEFKNEIFNPRFRSRDIAISNIKVAKDQLIISIRFSKSL